MTKIKTVLINQSSSNLMFDTVNAFVERGDEVALICGPFNSDKSTLHASVKVSHIIKYNRKSAIKRLWTWGFGTVQILWYLLTKYRGWDVIYVTNPPMSYFCQKFVKNSFSIIVYDIYPDALLNVGIGKNHFIYRWWSKQNHKIFSKAKHIFTLCDSMSSALEKYTDIDKLKVVPLWVLDSRLKPIHKNENEFVINHKLEDKFVVMYSGNMGYTHSVDKLVEIAAMMRNDTNIHFLFIGNGKKRPEIEKKIVDDQLTNCTVLDWQPSEIFPLSLAAADLGVITLNDDSAKISIPSKTFNLMAVGAPLLCLSPEEAEMRKLIAKYNNGACFSPSDLNNIVSFIRNLANDKELKDKYSINSINASKDFTRDNAKLYLTNY